MIKNKIIIWNEGVGDTSLGLIKAVIEDVSKDTGTEIIFECMDIDTFIERLGHIKDGRDSPDIVFMPQDMVTIEGACFSEVGEKFKFNIPEQLWNTMKYKGVQRGVPFLQGNHVVMYYNKKYMESPPRDFDEFLKFEVGKPIPLSIDVKNPYLMFPFINTFSRVNTGEENIRIEEGKLKEAISYILEFMDRNILASLDFHKEMPDGFINNQIVAIINGEWLFEYLHSKMGANLGVCRLPSIHVKETIGLCSTYGMAFPNNVLATDKYDVLLKFASHMLSQKIQEQWFFEYRRLPIIPSVFERVKYTSDGNWKEIIWQMEKNDLIMNSPSLPNLWDSLELALNQLYQNKRVDLFMSTYLSNKK